MNASILDIVEAYLLANGIGVVYDPNVKAPWSITKTEIFDIPFNIFTLLEAPARKIYRSSVTREVIENPVVEIRVRSIRQEGRAQLKAAVEKLDELKDYVYSANGEDITIQHAMRTRGIFDVGQDENQRQVFNIEYEFVVAKVADTP